MSQLFVYYGSKKVGVLTRDSDLVYSFKYTDEWLNDDKKFPLSLQLGLDKKTYTNKDTLSFFENLLPEGEAKNSIEKSQDVHGVFDFLTKYGQDCAGAITITADENYKEVSSSQDMVQVDEAKIYKALDEKKSVVEIIAEENPGYLSIAGAQDKFPAIYKNKSFYLPKSGAPTTHIVKMPIYRHNIKDSVYNELFCMNLAKQVGFKVPDCIVHQGKYPLYVVSRYDRYSDESGFTHRLHQQDFCQAQGFVSEFKYEVNGGPSIRNNYDLIINHTLAKTRIESIHIFLDWIAFNLLVGNNDSHSKNISFLMQNNRYEIAPMYDLVCTAVYPLLQKGFSFKIGGKTDYTRIGKKEFANLDAILDFKEGTFQERFQKMHEQISKSKESVIAEIEKKHGKIKLLEKINDVIESRSKTFRNQKALE